MADKSTSVSIDLALNAAGFTRDIKAATGTYQGAMKEVGAASQAAAKTTEAGAERVRQSLAAPATEAEKSAARIASAWKTLGGRSTADIRLDIQSLSKAYQALARSGVASAQEIARAQAAALPKLRELRAELAGGAVGGAGAGGGFGRGIGTLAAQFTGVNLAAGAAIGGLLGAAAAIVQVNKVNAETERQQLRIEGVLKATGGAAGLTAGQLDRLARRVGESTLASVEGVRAAEAKLLTFRTVSGETFVRTIKLAQDMAELGFGSIDAAATQLGKALENPIQGVSALNEVGVTFTAQQREQIKVLVETNRQLEAQQIILDTVSAQLGGVAETAGSKAAGAWDLLGQRVSEAIEALGEIPLVTDGVNGLAKAFGGLAGVMRSHEKNAALAETADLLDRIAQLTGQINFETLSPAQLRFAREELQAIQAELSKRQQDESNAKEKARIAQEQAAADRKAAQAAEDLAKRKEDLSKQVEAAAKRVADTEKSLAEQVKADQISAARDVLQAKKSAFDEELAARKRTLEEGLAKEKELAQKAKDLRRQAAELAAGDEDRLRAIRRRGMDEAQQQADLEAQIAEKLRSAAETREKAEKDLTLRRMSGFRVGEGEQNLELAAQQSIKFAQDAQSLAEGLADPATAARMFEQASRQVQAAYEAQASAGERAARDQAAANAKAAAAVEEQKGKLAEVDAALKALETPRSVTLTAELEQAKAELATLKGQLDAIQDKTVTVTVNRVGDSGTGDPAPAETPARAAGGPIPSFATGGAPGRRARPGLIAGPGTPTSDSILFRASRDEHLFVTRAARARQVFPLLSALNFGSDDLVQSVLARVKGLPALATGGPLPMPAGAAIPALATGGAVPSTSAPGGPVEVVELRLGADRFRVGPRDQVRGLVEALALMERTR